MLKVVGLLVEEVVASLEEEVGSSQLKMMVFSLMLTAERPVALGALLINNVEKVACVKMQNRFRPAHLADVKRVHL